jgi:hypothetical protein
MNPTRQNVFVLSNQLEEEDVIKFIDTKLYNPILLKRKGVISQFQTIPNCESMNEYFEELVLLGRPVLLGCGTTTLMNYFARESEPRIDTVIITVFTGDLKPFLLGAEFNMDWTKHYKLAFISDTFKHELGSFRFYVYELSFK